MILGPTNFGSKSLGPKNFGSKKFWVQKILSQKKFGSKKFWVRKNVGSEKILGPKKFWVQRNFGSKEIFGQKNVWSKKIMVQKFWVQKNVGSKNIWSKNKFESWLVGKWGLGCSPTDYLVDCSANQFFLFHLSQGKCHHDNFLKMRLWLSSGFVNEFISQTDFCILQF